MKKIFSINMIILLMTGLFGTSNFSSKLTDESETNVILNETFENLNTEKNLI